MIIIDIHHEKIISDWNKIKDKLILKCSQGTSFLDPKFKERQKEARKRGLYLGSYHFAGKGFLDSKGKLYFVAQDPIKEADWYLKNADYKKGELLILDWEINYSDPVDWCTKFLNRINEKTGADKWLYTNDFRANKYPFPSDWNFWIARYADYTGEFYPDFKPKFKNWKMHQYTSRGKVDGIVGDVDLSYLKEAPEPTGKIIHYSQNDPLWKKLKLGYSKLTVGAYGCTTSCICTLASWFGDKITPGQLSQQRFCYTNGGLIIWKQLENVFSKIKFLYRYYSFKEEIVDEYLIKNPDTAVLLNVDRGYHWVSALAKTKTGYKCSDPYPYPAKLRVYRKDEIDGFSVLIKK